jgi:hypothetical protein
MSEGSAQKRPEDTKKQRDVEALINRRREQLHEVEKLLQAREAVRNAARDAAARREALSDHLSGFYDEVDKLAKGRTMIEATPLIVQQANDIVLDAKAIVEGDTYLDRVKEFVPAGNNPVYPDVLVPWIRDF